MKASEDNEGSMVKNDGGRAREMCHDGTQGGRKFPEGSRIQERKMIMHFILCKRSTESLAQLLLNSLSISTTNQTKNICTQMFKEKDTLMKL